METIEQRLTKLAFKRSHPFCYSCYRRVTGTHCEGCGSDDNMRELENVAVEYGTSWIVEHLIEENLTPVDTEAIFEECVSQCYPETVKVGWMELDTISVMKTMDPIWWKMAISEHVDNEVTDEQLMTFDGGETYYRTSDVEDFIEAESA